TLSGLVADIFWGISFSEEYSVYSLKINLLAFSQMVPFKSLRITTFIFIWSSFFKLNMEILLRNFQLVISSFKSSSLLQYISYLRVFSPVFDEYGDLSARLR